MSLPQSSLQPELAAPQSPQKLVDTTDLPALWRTELRGAMALPKPMHNMDK